MKQFILLALLCVSVTACASTDAVRWQDIDGDLKPINSMMHEMSPVRTKGD